MSATTPSPVLSTAELAGRLDPVTVLDLRHVMGGRHPLPDETVSEVAVGRTGVSGGRPVVVYDDWQGRASDVTDTHDVLAPAVVGVDAALHPGDWSGWIADPARQDERG